MTEIVGMFKMVFQSVTSWFDSIVFTSGGGVFYFSMITVFLVFKFLLVPIFGAPAESDTASKSRRDQYKSYGGRYKNKGSGG